MMDVACVSNVDYMYEDHFEIIDTPLAFWTLDELKNSAHSKAKRKDWTGTKREKVGQLWSSTETGTVQGWAMVDSWCQLYPFNQAINDASSRKVIVLPKNIS